MTKEELKEIFPMTSESIISRYIRPLNDIMNKYEINNIFRQSAFLSQVGVESGYLRYKEEIGSGAQYDTGQLARNLGNTPQKDGDGQRFKGRGLIQITGRYNYSLIAKHLNKTLSETIEYLKSDYGAVHSAGWFWNRKNLNELADKENIVMITKRINGGSNGLKERKRLYNLAKKVLSRSNA